MDKTHGNEMLVRRTCTCKINEISFSGGRQHAPKDIGPGLLQTSHVHDQGPNVSNSLRRRIQEETDFDHNDYSMEAVLENFYAE